MADIQHTAPPAGASTLPPIWQEIIRPRHEALGHVAAIKRTESALVHWSVFAPGVTLAGISEQLVDRFRAWLLQSGQQATTARNYHLTIRRLIREVAPSICPSRQAVVRTQSSESDGTIWDLFGQYVGEREVSAAYRDGLRFCIADLERFRGDDLHVTDLRPELVNQWLAHAAKRGLSAETRKSRRRMVLTLWGYAADLDLVAGPRRVSPVKGRDRVNSAWTATEVGQLLDACDQLHGTYRNGVDRRLYWSAYVRAAWDSGLRGCDLRRLERSQIRPDGTVTLVQHKTGRRIRCRLRPATVAAIDATYPPDRPLCFATWGRLELWRREALRLVTLSGLKGGIGRLRHSSGTAVELENPGRGHEHLGNTRAVFEKHYLDLDQTAFERPLPPELKGGDA